MYDTNNLFNHFRTVANKVDLKSIIGQPIPEPLPNGAWALFEGYWIKKGPQKSEISDKVWYNLLFIDTIKQLSQLKAK